MNYTEGMRRTSRTYFGIPNLDSRGVAILQELIISTGAKEKLESMINQLTEQALEAAESELFSENSHPILLELTKVATKRST